MVTEHIRLTKLAHAGGGTSKVAPDILEKLLGGLAPGVVPPQLLSGREGGDDAAVYQLNAQQAIVATTDFFTPFVDDPHDFGRIAASNAISNIYAMGATPLFALALVGMPLKHLPLVVIAEVLAGGEAVCRQAGIPIAGGHTIDLLEPVYGLVVIGLVNPGHLKCHSGALPGDRLILGKQLGAGVYSEALQRDALNPADYEALLAGATQLNTPGPLLACLDGIHAVTDVAGSGLLGHLLGVCRSSKVAACVDATAVPRLPRTIELLDAGFKTAAAQRNWESVAAKVRLADSLGDAERTLLSDPQPAGGLLVACSPETVTEVLSIFLQQGFAHVSVIGEIVAGEPAIEVF